MRYALALLCLAAGSALAVGKQNHLLAASARFDWQWRNGNSENGFWVKVDAMIESTRRIRELKTRAGFGSWEKKLNGWVINFSLMVDWCLGVDIKVYKICIYCWPREIERGII